MEKTYALVDCNNFFASCEKIFNPSLARQPIVVLSNNDGCVIARSNEAKNLGIKMGEPFFQVKDLCQKHKVKVFSSNYQFYGDISQRVMSVLGNFTPNMEIYSIDEAFLDLTGLENNLIEYADEIVKTVNKWTGISVSVGIAPTKTLSKVANYYAKKYSKNGVCILNDKAEIENILALVAIEEIWGIGHKWAIKLRTLGIATALDLAKTDAKFIRKNFSVICERIVYELRGVSCLEIEVIEEKKSISSSRSFCMPITDLENLEEAMANYVARAAIKLRAQNSYAQGVYIYLKTNTYNKLDKQQHQSIAKNLSIPTNNTSKLIAIAKQCLAEIYQKGCRYKKCGVIFLDLVSSKHLQDNLFHTVNNNKEQILLKMMDATNKKMGSNTLSFAAMGTKKPWEMKREFCSNHYTTSWKELPRVG